MAKVASSQLRHLFAEELRNDTNATLETALHHVRDLYDRGPEEPAVAQVSDQLAEVEALILQHDAHTPLMDFVQADGL